MYPADFHMKIKDFEKAAKEYDKNYFMVFSSVDELDRKRLTITDPIKRCRFCDKSEPAVSFKKTAHAIPELIGNRRIFSNNECDTCNEKFSRVLEDSLGKYLGLWRTMMQIKGKNGVVSYKSPNGVSRIDLCGTGIKIKDFEEDCIIETNEREKTVTLKGFRQPYVPIAVFKCFVKMALSVIPYNLLGLFRDTKKWLLEDSHVISRYDIQPIFTIASSVPGMKPFGNLSIIVLCRKNDALKVPFMQMFIFFGNLGYQIIVPCKNKDYQLSGQIINITPFPYPIWAMNKSLGNIGISPIDFSGKFIVRDEPISITMSYQYFEDIPENKFTKS
jgi:hypothetical protein